MGFRFEWHPQKARENLRKHGVTFAEAATVLRDSRDVTIHDELHSDAEEDRFASIGLSALGRLIVVIYCEREDRIRIISA
jgi:uncharacterized DUF497 family protein